MKKLRIWGFCISFLSFNLWGFTQEVQLNEKIKNTTLDSIKFKGRTPLSLRFGIDLYRLTRSQFSDDYNGIELVGDFQIKKKIFLALEI